MKKAFLTFALCMSAAMLSGAATGAETGPVREFYVCNFNEGKGLADLMSVRDFLVKQIDQIGSEDLSAMESFVWVPYMSSTAADYMWFNMSENLNAWGRAVDAFNNSDEGAAVGQRSSEVSHCVGAGLVTHEQIYDGGEAINPPEGASALLETFACELEDGKTLADARAAVEYWQGVIKGLGTHTSYVAYMQTPLVNESPYDLFYFAVHNNATDYAARQTAVLTSKDGAEANRRFAEVQRCAAGLYWGTPIITPDQ